MASKYTEDEIDQFRQLWNSGMSAAQIAMRFRMTRNAVIGVAHRNDGFDKRTGRVPKKVFSPKRKPPALAPVQSLAVPDAPATQEQDNAPVAFHGCEEPASRTRTDRPGLLDLGPHDCRWPIGHVGEPDFHFCGETRKAGQSYCPHHCKKAYGRKAGRSREELLALQRKMRRQSSRAA